MIGAVKALNSSGRAGKVTSVGFDLTFVTRAALPDESFVTVLTRLVIQVAQAMLQSMMNA